MPVFLCEPLLLESYHRLFPCTRKVGHQNSALHFGHSTCMQPDSVSDQASRVPLSLLNTLPYRPPLTQPAPTRHLCLGIRLHALGLRLLFPCLERQPIEHVASISPNSHHVSSVVQRHRYDTSCSPAVLIIRPRCPCSARPPALSA